MTSQENSYPKKVTLTEEDRQNLLKLLSNKDTGQKEVTKLILFILASTIFLSFVLYAMAILLHREFSELNKFIFGIVTPIVSLSTGALGYYYGRNKTR